MTERIGIVGLGRMGRAMAARLAGQGVRVAGWTRSGISPVEAATLGIACADSLADLVHASDIVILSLYDTAAAREVLERLADLDLSGRLVVETSTIAPDVTPALAPAIEAAGGRLIDAPIAGGPEMVAAGTIGMYLGGAEADIARFRPVAAMLSGRVIPVGGIGMGHAAKIVNNTALSTGFTAIAQSIALGKRLGLELDTMLGFMADSPAVTGAFRARLPAIAGRDDTVGFSIAAALDDNEVFLDAAARAGHPEDLLRDTRHAFQAAADAGLGDRDVAAIVRFLAGS